MPVYNGERYLAQAIETVLNQTLRDLELIIVNDGSTDGSRAIAASYADPRIVLVDNEKNMGLSASLNRGIHLSRGEFVARQDADDLCHPDRLRRQVEYLRRHPEVALVGVRLQWVDGGGRTLRLSSPAFTCAQLRWGYLLVSTGISGAVGVFRRRPVLDTTGLYHAEFLYANDAEFHSRIARRFRVASLSEVLYTVRVHERQMTQTYGDIPRLESDRIALRNMLDLLESSREAAPPEGWDRHATDLVALRGVHTPVPEHVSRVPSATCRRLLLVLLRCFREVYGLEGEEWREFSAWLSREWLAAANVHLPERPGFAFWLWRAAVRLRWEAMFHRSSLRLLAKSVTYPAYVRMRRGASR